MNANTKSSALFREALGVRQVLVSLWVQRAVYEKKRCEDAAHSKSTSCKSFS